MNSHREQETEPQQPISISPHDYTYGQVVWAKTRSESRAFEWWPGQIFKPDIFVGPRVQMTRCIELPKSDDDVPVVLFGDGSYGWFDPKDVMPFSSGARTLPKQVSDKAFQNAVSEAFHEASRRGVEIPDYVHVDVPAYRSKVLDAFDKSYEEVFCVDVGRADKNKKRIMQRAITQGDEPFSAELKIAETPSSSHNNLNLNWQPSSSSSNQSAHLLLDLINCPPAPFPLEQPLAPLPPEQLAAPLPLKWWPPSSSSPNQLMSLLLEKPLAPFPLEQPAAPLPSEQPPEQLPPEQFIDELRTELNKISNRNDIYNLALRYNSLRPSESRETQNLAILLKLIWNIYPLPYPIQETPPDNWVCSYARYLRDLPQTIPVRPKYNRADNDLWFVKLGYCGYKDQSISLIPFRLLMGPKEVLARAEYVEPAKILHVHWFQKVAAGLRALNITGNRLIEAHDIIHLLHVANPTTTKDNNHNILLHIIRHAENIQPSDLWGQRILKYELRRDNRGGKLRKVRRDHWSRIFFQLTG